MAANFIKKYKVYEIVAHFPGDGRKRKCSPLDQLEPRKPFKLNSKVKVSLFLKLFPIK